MTAPSTQRQYGTVIWSGHPRFVVCPDNHLYRFRDEGMIRLQTMIEGHEFFQCRDCKPASHFFVVFSTSPDPHFTAYLVSEACFKEWAALPDGRSLPTTEMLFLIRDPLGRSYNPTWRGK